MKLKDLKGNHPRLSGREGPRFNGKCPYKGHTKENLGKEAEVGVPHSESGRAVMREIRHFFGVGGRGA